MPERNIAPPVFTREMRGSIKLRSDFETRAYIEALEAIAYAAAQQAEAHDDMTRKRVVVSRCLATVDFMRQ